MSNYKNIHYNRAVNILRRCNDKNSNRYHLYGARGIKCLLGNTISEVIHSLESIDGYEEGLTIDRIDVNGHYEIGNLRWATPKEQSSNRTTNKPKEYYSKVSSERYNFKAVCKKRGWNFDDFEEIFAEKSPNRRHSRYYYFYKGECC